MTKDQPTALDLPMVDPLPPETRKYFDICDEKLGMVPNVLKAHAFDIDKLNAFTAMYNELMLADSGLSKLEREMIAVVVSSVNKCFYCLTAHGAAVRQLSGDPKLGEMLVMNWRVADLPYRQRAMLSFVEKMTKASAEIAEYEFGNRNNHEIQRRRKLLVSRKELSRLWNETQRNGMTLVPLVLYFNHRGIAKVKIGIAKGKKTHDKRATEAKRDWQRQKQRLLRHDG